MRRIPCAGYRALTLNSPGHLPFAATRALSSTPGMKDTLWCCHADRVALRCCPTNL